MDKNTFFIGIDSGGTKSELLITDSENNFVIGKSYNAVHYSVSGKEKLLAHLQNIIADAVYKKKLNLFNCRGICIGLAGVREQNVKKELQMHLSKLLGFKNILIDSDSSIALYGAFGGNDGLILICGTGSILFGLINNKFVRIGGWGKIIGDYGSGYDIGKSAIKNLAVEYDRNVKLSRLSRAIERKYSINRKNILNIIYRDNFDLQKLVPLVLEYADKNDKDAKKIINKAVDELLYHFEVFFSTIKLKKKIKVAFSGSILENKNALSEKLKNKLKSNFGNIILTNKKHTAAEGAVFLAKNKFCKN